jgi:hypothetical protein
MKSHRQVPTFTIPARMDFLNITPQTWDRSSFIASLSSICIASARPSA